MSGYVGRNLEVELAQGTIGELPIPKEVQRKRLGGSGLAADLFFLRGKSAADPLGPDDELFVLTGPISGTLVPGSSRFAGAARSPLTGIWGEGSCGGDFAPALKRCGVDGLVFVGQSPRPVMLVLDGAEVALRDATDLWGLDTYETTDRLRETTTGGKRPSVLPIGPSGEDLVRFAAMGNNEHDFVGRTGMGAVMGSKRLKAVVCRGSGTIPIADPVAYEAICEELLGKISEAVPAQALKEVGTDSAMDLGMRIGDIPIADWSRGEDFELSNALSGPTMSETYLKRGVACSTCPIAFRREVEGKNGPYEIMAVGPGPEYETCAAFGTMLAQKDPAGVIKSNEWCNRYGADSISAGFTIAWAYDCFPKGLLTLEDTGGLPLVFGDVDGAIAMLLEIARRQGIGDLLAEGSRSAARRLERGSEDLTAEIEDLEIPMHDPRGSHGLALSYMTSDRGACHEAHLVEAIEHGLASYADVGPEESSDGLTREGKAPMVRIGEDLALPLNALALCELEMWCYRFDELGRANRAVTGWAGDSVEEYRRTGKRRWLLKRALNNLMGVTRDDDRLPLKIRTPVPDDAAAGLVPDEALLLREDYEERGLDEHGRPLRAVLEQAGLAEVGVALHRES